MPVYPGDFEVSLFSHPLSITGLEIDFEKGLRVSLIQWQYGIEGNKLAIRKIGIA